MQSPEDRFIEILDNTGVDFLLGLPCDRIKGVLQKLSSEGMYIPLTREEEGVGIAAGAALSGRKPAMIIQSSGFGNMINALLSLTMFYELPLAIFISHRGVYKEPIEAQKPMGKALKGLLRASGVPYTLVNSPDNLHKIERPLKRVFDDQRVHAFLLSPAVWEGCSSKVSALSERVFINDEIIQRKRRFRAKYTRYEIINLLKKYLKDNPVISNLGIPSKELYYLLHQPSNFYMLGSMGMATPIGLGVSLNTKKQVFVIDGDGSLLMNPGVLATVALFNPENLTILAIDNAAYGSTGNQPTHTSKVTDLSIVAKGFGIRYVYRVSSRKDMISALEAKVKGAKFIHIIARPGNASVPNIPLDKKEIRNNFMNSIS